MKKKNDNLQCDLEVNKYVKMNKKHKEKMQFYGDN